MGFMYKKKMLSFEIKNNVELVDSQPRAATQISSFSGAILSLDMILTAIQMTSEITRRFIHDVIFIGASQSKTVY